MLDVLIGCVDLETFIPTLRGRGARDEDQGQLSTTPRNTTTREQRDENTTRIREMKEEWLPVRMMRVVMVMCYAGCICVMSLSQPSGAGGEGQGITTNRTPTKQSKEGSNVLTTTTLGNLTLHTAAQY